MEVAFGNRGLLAADDGEVPVLKTIEHAETQRPVEAADFFRNRVLKQTEKNRMDGLRERRPLLSLDPVLLVEDDVIPNRASRSGIRNVRLQSSRRTKFTSRMEINSHSGHSRLL